MREVVATVAGTALATVVLTELLRRLMYGSTQRKMTMALAEQRPPPPEVSMRDDGDEQMQIGNTCLQEETLNMAAATADKTSTEKMAEQPAAEDAPMNLINVALMERGHAKHTRKANEMWGPEKTKVVRIAMTGGPCAGKSSFIAHLCSVGTEAGFDILTAPEIATLFFNSSYQFPSGSDPDFVQQKYIFQRNVLKLQLQMERCYSDLARSTGRDTIVVFDRGMLDPKAFMGDHEWPKALQEINAELPGGETGRVTDAYILERYDGVVHLVTAADGAEEHYRFGVVEDDMGNRVFRRETPLEAIEQDRALQRVWSAHPRHLVIKNTAEGSFSTKIDKAVKAVLDTPPPAKSEHTEDASMRSVKVALMERGHAKHTRKANEMWGPEKTKVVRIAVTGGPCAGKSSFIEHLCSVGTEAGFNILTAPEIATLFFNSSYQFPSGSDPDFVQQKYIFQRNVLKLQLQMERCYSDLARSTGRDTIVVFDRGMLDPKAFMGDHEWPKALQEINAELPGGETGRVTDAYILERYDGVVHLVTAADGAEEHYRFGVVEDDMGNRVFRRETPLEAIEQDRALQRVWSAHPRHLVIKNTAEGSFSTKMDEAVKAVLHIANYKPSPSLEWDKTAPSFYFLSTKYILSESPGRALPRMQQLQDQLCRIPVPLTSAFRGEGVISRVLFVSHRWEQPGDPDSQGVQLEAIRRHLRSRQGEIDYVWFDYACMAQRESPHVDGRTRAQKQEFDLMLSAIADLYLTANVLILLDKTYPTRFWTTMEAWCSMQTVTAGGVRPAREGEKRYTVSCIHNANPKYAEPELLELATKTPDEITAFLASPDVDVTNKKDKELMLPKVSETNKHVMQMMALATGVAGAPPAAAGVYAATEAN